MQLQDRPLSSNTLHMIPSQPIHFHPLSFTSMTSMYFPHCYPHSSIFSSLSPQASISDTWLPSTSIYVQLVPSTSIHIHLRPATSICYSDNFLSTSVSFDTVPLSFHLLHPPPYSSNALHISVASFYRLLCWG